MTTNANDIVRGVLGYEYVTGGTPMSNVWHWKDTGGGGITDADFINEFGALMEAILLPMLPQQGSQFDFVNITVQNLTQGLLIATLPWPTFVSGTAVSAVDTAQTAALLRLLTVKPRTQGRVFIPGIAEGAIQNSIFDMNTLVAAAAIGTALLAPQTVGLGELTYTVFNQILLTDNLPTSLFVGNAVRGLTRRKRA